MIWDRELSVKAIAAQLPVSVPAVSQHLAKLRAAGLVSVRADGRMRHYRATRTGMGGLGEVLESIWEKSPRPPGQLSAHPPTAIQREPANLPEPVRREPSEPVETSWSDSPTTEERPDGVAGTRTVESLDELTPWYRQGLHARVVALTVAHKALSSGAFGGAASIRRIAHSLTRPAIAKRFRDIGRLASNVAELGDTALAEGAERLIGAVRQESVREANELVRILVVEDSRVDAILTRSIISGANREVVMAGTAEEAQAVLDAKEIDLILLDLTLPGADGRELLMQLGRRPRTAAIPVILLTGKTDAQTRVEALTLGADAYLSKPVDRSVLSTAVAMMLESAAEGRQLGRQDPLTGLKNRAVFLDDARQLSAAAVRGDVALSLAILEIGRLAAINDFHGSEAGDGVVTAVADCLAATFRESDSVARWSGSKVAVLFANTDAGGAVRALAKLREATQATSVILPDGTSLVPTWHAGVASLRDRADVEHAVARATRRLQKARRSGSDRAIVADDAQASGPRTILLIEDDQILADLIEHRMSREGFEVVRFGDGAEALAGIAAINASAVVLDTMLPGVDGFEVLRRIRESPSYAGVPVIVLTFGGSHDADRAFKLGARDSLAKPFSVKELVARVSRLVADFDEASSP